MGRGGGGGARGWWVWGGVAGGGGGGGGGLEAGAGPRPRWLYPPFGYGDGAGGDAEQVGHDGPRYCQALPHDGDQGFSARVMAWGRPPARRRVAGPPRAMCISASRSPLVSTLITGSPASRCSRTRSLR